MSKLRKNIYIVISSIIVLGIFFGFSIAYPQLYQRFWMSLKDFGTACWVYADEMLETIGIDLGAYSTVTESNFINGFTFAFFPDDWGIFWKEVGYSFQLLVSGDYATHWLALKIPIMKNIANIIMILIPIVIFVVIGMNSYLSLREPAPGTYTKGYYFWVKFVDKWEIVKENIKDYFYWFKSKKIFMIPLIIELVFLSNVASIIISFLAYYIYLTGTFEFSSIWFQIWRLFCDLSHLFRKEFTLIWLVASFIVFFKCCTSIAKNRKQRALARNKAFVRDDCGLATLFIGNPGRGKTTIMTDVGITAEEVYRDIAFEKMLELSSLFPWEDWRVFELNLEYAFLQGEFHNLASLKEYLHNGFLIDDDRDNFIECGNETVSLYDTQFKYAQLYWVYQLNTSFIYSNYGIRSGIFALDVGHLKEYFNDFSDTDSELYDQSRFSHIFDFDNFRLTRMVDVDNDKAKAVDFGIFAFDEIGKERKNKVELEDVDKSEDDANQKNDGFNISIKMGRHPSTIDNYPFFKLFASEQRESSVPADFRELNDVIAEISTNPKTVSLYPFYWFFGWILDCFESGLSSLWSKYRFNRDENTMIFQWIKSALSLVVKTKRRMINTWGMKILTLNIYDGHGEIVRTTEYDLVISKIYSRRFATDAYADFYNKRNLESKFGICDIDTYSSERASIDELKKQNSYFINDLVTLGKPKVKKQEEKKTYPARKKKNSWSRYID